MPQLIWGPGILRSSQGTTIELEECTGPDIEGQTNVSADCNVYDSFAVFDVYLHSRVLQCPRSLSLGQRILLAIEQTPQISADRFGYRSVRPPLPGLPMQQFVIWGDKLPSTVILPVSIGIGPGDICTVEVPLEYSAVQLTTIICRHCQLPDSIIEAVANTDARILVNGETVYPLDPGACRAADTAQLHGAIFWARFPPRTLAAAPSSSSQGQSASSECTSAEIARLVRPLVQEQDALHAFTIFAEGASPLVLAIPQGASIVDLIAQAFKLFPEFGPQCGHRVLSRPVTGFPPLQLCIWGSLEPNTRVVVLVTLAGDTARTVCVPCAATATQLAGLAAGTLLQEAISARTLHLSVGGRPCQPHEADTACRGDVFRVCKGPPPARVPSAHVRRALPQPAHALPIVPASAISDGDIADFFVIHQLGSTHRALPVPSPLTAAHAAIFAASLCANPVDARLLIPDVSPLMRGTPPHAILTSLPPSTSGAHAIIDLRRVLRPPVAPFVAVHLPNIVNARAILELLGHAADTLDAVAAIYLDGSLLQQGASIHNDACTVTLLGYDALRPTSGNLPAPAVLRTSTALAHPVGPVPFTLRAAFGMGCTSTSTTPIPSAPATDSGAASAMAPGDLATSHGAVPETHAEVTTVTNPTLLDFLRDELAITRVADEELPYAYTLFDGVLQTRLAAKSPNWGTAECLADAHKHFNHLGPRPEIRLIRDIVEGLPVPQFAATPRLIAHRFSAFPIDARPAGRGICVVDAPRDVTPFSLAYQASAACAMTGRHQQIARRDCTARGRGRPLQPFEPVPDADSVVVGFHDSAPHYFFSQRSAQSPDIAEALQAARDLLHAISEHADDVSFMLHRAEGPPVEIAMPRHCSFEALHAAAGQALAPLPDGVALQLHALGGTPRGTDCILHFLAAHVANVRDGRTLYLIDGRPLHPAGPPFRTLDLPDRLTLGELFGLVREVFPEASPASFLRMNRRLLRQLTLQRFHYPVVRALPLGAVNEEPDLHDDFLWPTADLVEGFPGLWIARRQLGLTTTTTTAAVATVTPGSDPVHGHLDLVTACLPTQPRPLCHFPPVRIRGS